MMKEEPASEEHLLRELDDMYRSVADLEKLDPDQSIVSGRDKRKAIGRGKVVPFPGGKIQAPSQRPVKKTVTGRSPSPYLPFLVAVFLSLLFWAVLFWVGTSVKSNVSSKGTLVAPREHSPPFPATVAVEALPLPDKPQEGMMPRIAEAPYKAASPQAGPEKQY